MKVPMRSSPRRILAATALLLVLALPAALRATHEPPAGLPLVQLTGHDSARVRPGFVLVRADDVWRQLWAEHSGKPTDPGMSMSRNTAPRIDFSRCLAVAHFAGRRTNCDGELVEEVREFADHLRIRFTASTFQTAGPDERGGAVDVTPYAFWILPATRKAIVIEQGRQSLKNKPVEWAQVHRFEAAQN